jgi:hypothetical protein
MPMLGQQPGGRLGGAESQAAEPVRRARHRGPGNGYGNQHFTLKQNRLTRAHLQDFVDCHAAGKPHADRVETERFRAFGYDEPIARDKVNLDITWLRDDSLEDLDNLPAPRSSPARSSRT